MKAFRLCNEAEINKILATHSFKGLGKECEVNPKLNNHQYQPHKRYMHFFKDFGSIFYLFPDSGKYICTYDFPTDLLDKTLGEGSYLDYFFFRNLQSAKEYAIPEASIDFSHLSRVDRVLRDIEIEDYIADQTLGSLTENIYDSAESAKSQILDK